MLKPKVANLLPVEHIVLVHVPDGGDDLAEDVDDLLLLSPDHCDDGANEGLRENIIIIIIRIIFLIFT